MKAFKVIGIAIFRDRNLGFEVLGLCNFKCYHYVVTKREKQRLVLGLCNFKCDHYGGLAYKRTKGEWLKTKKFGRLILERQWLALKNIDRKFF